MDKDDVMDPGDIAAAAAAMRSGVQTTIEPAAKPEPSGGTPDPEPAEPAPATPDGEPAPAADPSPDSTEDEPKRDAQSDWDAEMKRREADIEAREKTLKEERTLAESNIRHLLENPDEYTRVRKELGLEAAPAASPAPKPEAKPADAKPAGPDPLDNPEMWRLSRILAYQRYFEAKPADERPSLADIERAADNDLLSFQLKATNERTKKLEAQIAARDAADRDKVASAQKAAAVDAVKRELAPLIKQYPGLEEDAEDIEAAVHYARSRGGNPNLAAVVKRFADKNATVIKRYADSKKKLAAGAAPAKSAGGGSSQAPSSAVTELPPTTQSIMELARMGKSGQLK